MDILHWRTLTALVRKVKPVSLRAAPFFTGTRINPTNRLEYDQIRGSQAMVNYRHPNGAAGVIHGPTYGQVKVDLMTIREKVSISATEDKWLRAPGALTSRYGQQLITDRLTELVNKIERRKEATRWDMLQDGIASLPVETDGGAIVTVTADFQVRAAHKVDVSADGDNEPWSTISTNILAHIAEWKRTARQSSVNGELVEAYASDEVLDMIRANTGAQGLMSDAIKRQAYEGTPGFLFQGIRWIPMDEGYRTGDLDTDTFLTYVDQDADDRYVIFKTAGSLGVNYETIAPDQDNTENVTGLFVKSYVDKDPSVRWLLGVETSLPVLMYPDDIFVARVV